jgi:hypothetical protein
MDLTETELDGTDWIDLVPNRDQWRALESAGFITILGISFIAAQLAGFC